MSTKFLFVQVRSMGLYGVSGSSVFLQNNETILASIHSSRITKIIKKKFYSLNFKLGIVFEKSFLSMLIKTLKCFVQTSHLIGMISFHFYFILENFGPRPYLGIILEGVKN